MATRAGARRTRRASWTVAAALVLAAGACASVATVGDRDRARLPAPLHRLTLLEEHPRMPPVAFDHALHVDRTAMGRAVACADCHHTLRDRPADVPQACVTCHGFAHETPPVDESLPHDHSEPPDL